MLGLFINRPIDTNTVFLKPPNIIPDQNIQRPEIKMFDYQNKIFDAQNDLLSARNRPKISFFAQGGFGKTSLQYFK